MSSAQVFLLRLSKNYMHMYMEKHGCLKYYSEQGMSNFVFIYTCTCKYQNNVQTNVHTHTNTCAHTLTHSERETVTHFKLVLESSSVGLLLHCTHLNDLCRQLVSRNGGVSTCEVVTESIMYEGILVLCR